MKNEINSKQDFVDSILERNSNLLTRQCCRFKQHPETNWGNHRVRSDDRTLQTIMSGKHSLNKTELLKTSLIYIICARVKKICRPSTPASCQSITINLIEKRNCNHRWFCKKHVNGREVSRVNLVKTRYHLGATTEDFIDFIKPTTRKKPWHVHYIYWH